MRKQHRRPRAALQLSLHCPLILPQDFQAAARGQFARFEIQQDIDFPGEEVVPENLALHEFAEETPEAIQRQFPLFEIVYRHRGEIGRRAPLL